MASKQTRKPVQARAEVTRAKILDVARRQFAERGVDAANTRDIAQEAGVSHAMIRYHFSSKDNLWREAIMDMYDRLWDAIGVDSDDPLDLSKESGFREFVRRYIVYAAKHPEYARIMIAESVRGGARLKWMADKFIRPAHARYSEALNHHMDSGFLPKGWPISILMIIAAVCQMPFVLAAEIEELYGVDMSSDAAIEAHIDTVYAFLFRDPSRVRADWPILPG